MKAIDLIKDKIKIIREKNSNIQYLQICKSENEDQTSERIQKSLKYSDDLVQQRENKIFDLLICKSNYIKENITRNKILESLIFFAYLGE